MSHGRDTSPKPYGVVAEFNSPEELLKAARSAKDKGYSKMEGYSPIPVHGLLDVIGKEDNRLGWLVFGAGVTGAAAGLILQVYTSTGFKFVTGIAWLDSWIQNTGLNGYQHNVGGKPNFLPDAMPAYVPVTFELTILLAGLTAAGAMLALNGLPKPHHPVFNAEAMTRASQDGFILCIEADDPNYDPARVVDFLESLNPKSVEVIQTSEGY